MELYVEHVASCQQGFKKGIVTARYEAVCFSINPEMFRSIVSDCFVAQQARPLRRLAMTCYFMANASPACWRPRQRDCFCDLCGLLVRVSSFIPSLHSNPLRPFVFP
jgi:hypothetical protein